MKPQVFTAGFSTRRIFSRASACACMYIVRTQEKRRARVRQRDAHSWSNGRARKRRHISCVYTSAHLASTRRLGAVRCPLIGVLLALGRGSPLAVIHRYYALVVKALLHCVQKKKSQLMNIRNGRVPFWGLSVCVKISSGNVLSIYLG